MAAYDTPQAKKPLLREYNAIEQVVRAMVQVIPVDRGEVIYFMELEKMQKIYMVLALIGFSIMGLIFVFPL
jgi:hypothetical protein